MRRFNNKIPTAKKMLDMGFADSDREAKEVRSILEKAAPDPDKMLIAVDQYMNKEGSGGCFGVEDLYPDYPHIYYINTGDTYNVTLVYDNDTGSIKCESWADAAGIG